MASEFEQSVNMTFRSLREIEGRVHRLERAVRELNPRINLPGPRVSLYEKDSLKTAAEMSSQEMRRQIHDLHVANDQLLARARAAEARIARAESSMEAASTLLRFGTTYDKGFFACRDLVRASLHPFVKEPAAVEEPDGAPPIRQELPESPCDTEADGA